MARHRKLMNQINVVPYIDVMLVLLVIFMVTAPMIQTGTVDLPSVGEASQPKVAPLQVLLKADGTLTIRDLSKDGGEERLALDQLADSVVAAQMARPDQAVVLAADKTVRYAEVMAVMDTLQKNNVQRIGLMVEKSGVR